MLWALCRTPAESSDTHRQDSRECILPWEQTVRPSQTSGPPRCIGLGKNTKCPGWSQRRRILVARATSGTSVRLQANAPVDSTLLPDCNNRDGCPEKVEQLFQTSART